MVKIVIMGKINNIKYAYFDLDGTFLNNDNEISNYNLEAIKKLRSLGIKVGIATGRTFHQCLEHIKTINPDLPTISINGNLLWDRQKDETFAIKTLSQDSFNKWKTFASKHKINFAIYNEEGIYFKEHINSKRLIFYKNLIAKQPQGCKLPLFKYKDQKLNIYKVLVILSDSQNYDRQAIKKFCNNLEGAYYVYSQHSLADIMPSDVNKGSGLKLIAKKGYIDLKETIVFADGENDLEMLEVAKISVAMINGVDDIKQKATYITKYDNNNSGVATFINDYF